MNIVPQLQKMVCALPMPPLLRTWFLSAAGPFTSKQSDFPSKCKCTFCSLLLGSYLQMGHHYLQHWWLGEASRENFCQLVNCHFCHRSHLDTLLVSKKTIPFLFFVLKIIDNCVGSWSLQSITTWQLWMCSWVRRLVTNSTEKCRVQQKREASGALLKRRKTEHFVKELSANQWKQDIPL